MTQCEAIIKYIRDFGSITTRDAFLDLGIESLHRRMSDLKEGGYKFGFCWEIGKNRYGKKVKWKRYWFKDDGRGLHSSAQENS